MKLIDESGREVTVTFRESQNPIREKSRSNFQKEAYLYLNSVLPCSTILEEWFIPNSKLSFDFFIPELGLLIECQGKQHKRFVKFFHGNREGFLGQKKRDRRKALWAEANELELICVYSVDELKEKIK